MTRIEKLEEEIRRLGPDELAALRAWFQSYDSDAWDRQIAADAALGRLSPMADKAEAAHKAGLTTKL